MIVAIDGPVGVGKTTVARAVAERLGFVHIDTGAMYRALALRCLEDDLDPDDAVAMGDLAKREPICMELSPEGLRVYIHGEDVSDEIRSPEVTALVSRVSAHAGLREVVVAQQREMGATGNVVMEGRDIGSVVFPQADVKIYLDATLDSRVKRRAGDFETKGIPWSFEEIRQSIVARDEYDRTRKVSPLRVADDALVLDSSDLTFDQVVGRMIEIIRERMANPSRATS